VGRVALTGREQASGVAEVGTAVARIDSATQTNAATAQGAAEAAADLAELVDGLEALVEQFRIDAADNRRRLALAG
jgi:methyl-accepting chemotaxis protein